MVHLPLNHVKIKGHTVKTFAVKVVQRSPAWDQLFNFSDMIHSVKPFFMRNVGKNFVSFTFFFVNFLEGGKLNTIELLDLIKANLAHLFFRKLKPQQFIRPC
jgi:hypothetical protein